MHVLDLAEIVVVAAVVEFAADDLNSDFVRTNSFVIDVADAVAVVAADVDVVAFGCLPIKPTRHLLVGIAVAAAAVEQSAVACSNAVGPIADDVVVTRASLGPSGHAMPLDDKPMDSPWPYLAQPRSHFAVALPFALRPAKC